MVATSLAAIVFAGVLSAYLFMGRNLTRLVNSQEQNAASRRALQNFTQDLSAAIRFTTATSTDIVLLKQPRSATANATDTVTYTYSSGNRTLTRGEVIVDSAATPSTVTTSTELLRNVTALTFNYYNESGTAVTLSPQSVKSVEVTFTTGVGSSTSGTRASYTTVSPRVVVRNKLALQ